MLRRMLRENLHWKLISLVFACALWWYVESGYNEIEEPRQVSVVLKNQPVHLVRTSDLVDRIDVRLRGPATVIGGIRPDELRYVIDLSGASAGANQYSIIAGNIAGLPGGVRVTDVSPSQLSLVFDVRAVKENVPVSILTRGQPALGYEVGEMTASPAFVTIDGAKGQVERTTSVPTEVVDLTGARATVTRVAALNVGGTYVEVKDASEVSVRVEIRPKMIRKDFRIPVRAVNTALAARIEPRTVGLRLRGPLLVLDPLTDEDVSVYVDAEDLEPGAYTLPLAVDLPDDTQIEGEAPATAKVVLTAPPPPVVEGKKRAIGVPEKRDAKPK